MREHGRPGARSPGRVLQVVTGSAGIDDYEWGVTLFGRPSRTTSRRSSTRCASTAPPAVYAEFGPFYAGMVTPLDDLLAGR